MFHHEIEPRFNDTDALGHISNTAFPAWFEQARTPVFRLFHPGLGFGEWNMILARVEIDFKAQSYWSMPVNIRTYIGKIGSSSVHVIQEAWQGGTEVARGLAVLIYFDYTNEQAQPIPDEIRTRLEEHQAEV